jgi:hypothetical protein
MKKLILFTLLSVLSLVGFSQSFGRLKIHSGLYDNYVINGSDTSIFGWRNDRLQLRYNGNKRFMDFVKSDSAVKIYNKLILESPNDTMLSVRGASSFSDAITAKYGNNVFKWLNEIGSFVAGYDGNNIWNEDSVGEYSVAFGYETKAGSRSPIPELSVYPLTVINDYGNIHFHDNTHELCSALEPYINYNFSVYDSSTSTDYGIVKLTNTCCEFSCRPVGYLIDTETTPVGLIGGETVSFTLINPFPSSSYNYASGYKSTVKGDGSFVHGIENSVNGAGSAILTGYNNSIQSDGSVVLSGEYNNCFGDNNFAFGDTNLVGFKLDSIVYSHDSVVDVAHYIGAPQQFYAPWSEYNLLSNYTGQFVEVIDLATGINYGMFPMAGFGKCMRDETCYFSISGFTEEFNSLQIQINFNFDTTEYSTIKDFGIVFGDNNTVAGEHSSIIGGKYNYVSGDYSAIISGFRDTLLVDSTVLFKNINIHDTLRFGDFSKQWTAWIPNVSDTGFVKTVGDTMYGNLTILGSVSVEKSIQVGNDATAASAANVGAIRYRSDANNSYCEMVMQTGASTYAWVIIKQNTW